MADITDPKAMRALAHPLRIQLLEALLTKGEATATVLADMVNESPSNCSFHLRKLAQHGYIERADDAAGREKPWRVVDPTQNFVGDSDDPQSLQASTAVSAAFREWDVARMRAADGRPNPKQWRGTTFQRGATMYLTPDEAKGIEAGLAALVEPYLERLTDPSKRPDGGGLVRLFAATTYLIEYQDQLDAEQRERAAARNES
ncbi:ArsR/SmtB family transcription factor [Nakamurella lactea]|uniref:ArsR/SmtB family transcription factor n=1 Tax=Nakamurella lactea TaxID=459515 RepID=UPI00041D8A0F|nr:helix-turn-helix domain-containing protein [Nakamurella lactea]